MDTCVVWHGHHEAEFPIEVLPESYESRLRTIETVKSLRETPQKIAWRKKLFKVVIGPLPAPVQDAVDKLSKARAAWNKAWAECDKALAEFDKAVKAHLPKILKLHSKECGCAWTPNNRNIFSYMPGGGTK